MAGDPYYKHYALAFPIEFHKHDAVSFYKLVDDYAAKYSTLGITARKELMTDTGQVWNPYSITMDLYLRQIYCPAINNYWDPQHCLVASSGASQYHLNGFCNHYREIGGNFADVDKFQQSIIWPSNAHKLPRQYFEKHVVKGAGKHIRSFASDVLSAVLACCWFCKIVLRPLKEMVEHSKALELLQVVHDIFK